MASRFRSRSTGSPTWLAMKVVIAAGLVGGITSAASCAPDDSSSSGRTSSGDTTSGSGGAGGEATTSAGGNGTGGGTTTTSGTGGAGGTVMTGCKDDKDCAADPAGPFCNTGDGECVQCLPTNDICMQGQYCDPVKNKCVVGCTDDTDCDPANNLFCDKANHACVGCVGDANCPLGSICIGNTCIAGCNDQQSCQSGFTCCSNNCYDFNNDIEHCGGCDSPCVKIPHAETLCVSGMCTAGNCDPGWASCNGDAKDGCEQNTLQDGACTCVPGATQPCYYGSPGTQNIGPCKGGTQTCNADGLGWGACVGQVLPVWEICANNIDEDCNGVKDDAPDLDGDGWSKCDGDCCDSIADGCVDPKLVNPGAFDFNGNNFDDDCDGTKDNGEATCDAALASNSAVATDYAKAIDLCATTTANPSLPNKRWGVLSANLFLSNGAGTPNASSRAIRPGFGATPTKKGSKLAVISTGNAADSNDVNPSFVAFETGTDLATSSTFPNDWFAANGNNVPNAPGCPDPLNNTAEDPVMIKVQVRVPTNVKSFNVSVNFMSAEYPEWVCTEFNDFFVALLDSTFVPGPGETANPTDKNLAFYDPPPAGPPYYPVGVNLAALNNGLFSQCKNGTIGCSGFNSKTITTCQSTAQLVGTGFDPADNVGGVCNNGDIIGGGTGWLTTSGNVVPGETITLRFVVWDTSDGLYDSVALIDNFTWSAAPATPGTHN